MAYTKCPKCGNHLDLGYTEGQMARVGLYELLCHTCWNKFCFMDSYYNSSGPTDEYTLFAAARLVSTELADRVIQDWINGSIL